MSNDFNCDYSNKGEEITTFGILNELVETNSKIILETIGVNGGKTCIKYTIDKIEKQSKTYELNDKYYLYFEEVMEFPYKCIRVRKNEKPHYNDKVFFFQKGMSRSKLPEEKLMESEIHLYKIEESSGGRRTQRRRRRTQRRRRHRRSVRRVP